MPLSRVQTQAVCVPAWVRVSAVSNHTQQKSARIYRLLKLVKIISLVRGRARRRTRVVKTERVSVTDESLSPMNLT